MLGFLLSLILMYAVIMLSMRWAKRKESRLAAIASEFDGVQEVYGNARDHR
jgi:hypothetical protein